MRERTKGYVRAGVVVALAVGGLCGGLRWGREVREDRARERAAAPARVADLLRYTAAVSAAPPPSPPPSTLAEAFGPPGIIAMASRSTTVYADGPPPATPAPPVAEPVPHAYPSPLEPEEPLFAYLNTRDAPAFIADGSFLAEADERAARSFRALTEQPDAAARFREMASDPAAFPVGHLNALLGLRRADRTAYARLLARLRSEKRIARFVRNGVHGEAPVGELARRIDAGAFDATFAALPGPFDWHPAPARAY